MNFSLPSFAKINWTLRILGKREDGFHELCTVLQTISLHDTIEFSSAAGPVTLTCDEPGLAADESNLILRAARALNRNFPDRGGAAIHLSKRIPYPGGLGGGSSNAAVALIGICRLWNVEPTLEELGAIAVELGSDVPYFLHGGTCLGTGRGESIESLPDHEEANLLVVTPAVDVSTASAFSTTGAPILTNGARDRILPVCRNGARSLDPHYSELVNDLESSVFKAHPEVKRVKGSLLELGAVNAAMSGSGASVFAIFDKTETRQTAMKALDKESTWRKFAVSTVSRSQYREALGI